MLRYDILEQASCFSGYDILEQAKAEFRFNFVSVGSCLIKVQYIKGLRVFLKLTKRREQETVW